MMTLYYISYLYSVKKDKTSWGMGKGVFEIDLSLKYYSDFELLENKIRRRGRNVKMDVIVICSIFELKDINR